MPESAPSSYILTTETKHFPDGVAVVHCNGRLVTGAVDILSATVRELIPTNKRIILDLLEVEHTDSTGLGILVRLYVAAKAAGCSVELMHLNKPIQELLVLTHLYEVFTVVGEKGVEFG